MMKTLTIAALVCGLVTAGSALAAANQDYFVKKPAGTLTYKIVLSGAVNQASPDGTPKKQQFHDIVNIHRVIEVNAQMYQVPTASSPDCGRACGDGWTMKALAAVQTRAAKACADNADYACRAKSMQAAGLETNRIMLLGNLQSVAESGPTWSQMQPCTATVTIDDTETLTHYVYADEAGTDEDPGLVTSKGSQTGSVKNAKCNKVLDRGYAIYLTAPKDAHGYILQLPAFVIPTTVKDNRYGEGDNSSAGAGSAELPNGTIRLGDDDKPLPLPAAGQPFSGTHHIKVLFKLDQTPVYHQVRSVPLSADISWRFTPAAGKGL